MKRLTCKSARRQLEAFHDRELSLADQIAVERHLEACEACAAFVRDMQVLRAALSTSARSRALPTDDESFRNGVLTRLKVERSTALSARVRSMFEDMRLVYAGLGATAAATAGVLLMFNMTSLLANERPGSLAGVVNSLAARETVAAVPSSPVAVDARMLTTNGTGLILAADSDQMGTDADAEYALRAVVTREGRVKDVELLHARSGRPVAPHTAEARAFSPLVGAVSRVRFEPARVDGIPVASNVVMQIPHTTVRASESPGATSAPASKKRATLTPSRHAPERV
jgi:hypothetical protein